MTDRFPTEEEYSTEYDPFSPEAAPGVQLMVQLRIYDVLMALLTAERPDIAKDLMELHQQGHLMGSSPRISGTFIADSETVPND